MFFSNLATSTTSWSSGPGTTQVSGNVSGSCNVGISDSNSTANITSSTPITSDSVQSPLDLSNITPSTQVTLPTPTENGDGNFKYVCF